MIQTLLNIPPILLFLGGIILMIVILYLAFLLLKAYPHPERPLKPLSDYVYNLPEDVFPTIDELVDEIVNKKSPTVINGYYHITVRCSEFQAIHLHQEINAKMYSWTIVSDEELLEKWKYSGDAHMYVVYNGVRINIKPYYGGKPNQAKRGDS